MAKTPFTIVPSLAAIAVAYPQGTCIADQVLPRVPVATRAFTYLKYGVTDNFRMPDTRVGRTSAPNVLDWVGTSTAAEVEDHALDSPVPNRDVAEWQIAQSQGGPRVAPAVDPLARRTELVMQAVMNRREKRAADLVFTLANYASTNRTTLSGTDQWSDFVNSDPLTKIMTALDACYVRPNIGVLGRDTATKLQMHPKICKAIFGNNTDAGIVPIDAIARLLGLQAIYVGEAFVNTSADGLTPTISRAWGKHASFMYRDMQASPDGGVTFGFTAQWGDRIGGTYDDAKIGALGGTWVRAGEFVKELITANDLAYFFQNAVA